MGRVADWEQRLTNLLRDASIKEFSAKRWNCALFAHACAEALTGEPIPFRWKGSLEASADAALTRVAPRKASRGDIVLAEVPSPSLGVCVGRMGAFVTTNGLLSVPMHRITAAWAV